MPECTAEQRTSPLACQDSKQTGVEAQREDAIHDTDVMLSNRRPGDFDCEQSCVKLTQLHIVLSSPY